MNDQTVLYSFEIDKDFVEILHQEIMDPRVHIYHASATDIRQYVTEPVDIVLSTLPLSNMNDALVDSILQASKDVLKPEGYFFQCQYSKRSLKNIQNIFTKIDVKFELFNLPPAFIYKCKN
jgi:phospholipid N-methyltransferase